MSSRQSSVNDTHRRSSAIQNICTYTYCECRHYCLSIYIYIVEKWTCKTAATTNHIWFRLQHNIEKSKLTRWRRTFCHTYSTFKFNQNTHRHISIWNALNRKTIHSKTIAANVFSEAMGENATNEKKKKCARQKNKNKKSTLMTIFVFKFIFQCL